MSWDVKFTGRAKKQTGNLPNEVRESLFALALEIEKIGPARTSWPNYGKIKGKKDCYHCHLKEKGQANIRCHLEGQGQRE